MLFCIIYFLGRVGLEETQHINKIENEKKIKKMIIIIIKKIKGGEEEEEGRGR